MTTGISKANAPTLLMKADRMPTSTTTAPVCSMGPRLKVLRPRASQPIRPEFCIAREIARTAATVMTAGCPKPLKACSAGISPPITTASKASSATTS